MRVKKVNRYWCDFCNKAGLSASHMSKHEKHCTMNPNRECRVCKMLEPARDVDFIAKPLNELIAMLPDSAPYHSYHHDYEYEKLIAQMKEVLAILRKATGDCPACIMAALRQAKIPIPMVEEFNFTEEMKLIWDSINFNRDMSIREY